MIRCHWIHIDVNHMSHSNNSFEWTLRWNIKSIWYPMVTTYCRCLNCYLFLNFSYHVWMIDDKRKMCCFYILPLMCYILCVFNFHWKIKSWQIGNCSKDRGRTQTWLHMAKKNLKKKNWSLSYKGALSRCLLARFWHRRPYSTAVTCSSGFGSNCMWVGSPSCWSCWVTTKFQNNNNNNSFAPI